jgi:hypothetical protein
MRADYERCERAKKKRRGSARFTCASQRRPAHFMLCSCSLPAHFPCSANQKAQLKCKMRTILAIPLGENLHHDARIDDGLERGKRTRYGVT